MRINSANKLSFSERVLITASCLMFVLLFLQGENYAQSANKYNPTPVRSREIAGGVDSGKTLYYAFTAGPGEVRASVAIMRRPTATGATEYDVTFEDPKGLRLQRMAAINGGAGESSQEKTFRLQRKTRVLMIVKLSGSLDYKIKLDGAVKLDREEESLPIEDDFSVIKTIRVDGKTGFNWVDTGIVVKAGDVVRLSATGEVDVNAGWGVHGPEGTREFFTNASYPINSRFRYGLAARITLGSGRNFLETQKWAYADAREMRVTRSGILWLTVNDDEPDDNTGQFVVEVALARRSR